MRVSDEQIIAALYANGTNKAAATALGMSEKWLYSRIRAPDFREKLSEAKQQLLERATNSAESRLNAAIGVMAEIMSNDETAAGTRVAAADALIRNTLKLIEMTDIESRLDELEKILKENDE